MSLSMSDLVVVDVVLSPQAVPVRNFGALLLLGASTSIDVSQRMRKYSALTQVAVDFATSSPEYQAASLFFAQSPTPSTLYIGRWAQTAASGLLHGAALTVSQQAIANFNIVTAGNLNVTIDGTPKSLTSLNFSTQTNLNGVANTIQTALAGVGTCTWNAAANRFEIVSATTGSTSSVAVTVGGAGDVSAVLGVGTGSQSVAGIASESMIAAVQAVAAKSSNWYGLAIAATGLIDSDLVAVAQYIEASSPKRFFVATTQEAGALDSTVTSDLASLMAAQNLTHTAVQYSSSNPFAGVSMFARQASVDFAANNSTITLMFKGEPGVASERLSETQAATLRAKNCNVFALYTNQVAIIQFGTVANGNYIDTIVGTDWLQNQAQNDVFNLLYTSQTKIPQTDAGVNMIVTTLERTMEQAVSNGLLAPGVWSGPAIGAIASGQTLTKGYYLYAPPVASQSAADRAARKSPTIQCAVKLGGAIHEADVVINVAQ